MLVKPHTEGQGKNHDEDKMSSQRQCRVRASLVSHGSCSLLHVLPLIWKQFMAQPTIQAMLKEAKEIQISKFLWLLTNKRVSYLSSAATAKTFACDCIIKI